MLRNKRVIGWLVTVAVIGGLVGALILGACAAPTPTPTPTPTLTPTPGPETVTWKWFDHDAAFKSTTYWGSEWIEKELEERSDGRFLIDSYWGGQVGGPPETLGLITAGVCDVANLVPAYYLKQFPLLNILSLPFLPPVRTDWYNYIANEIISKNANVVREVEKFGLVWGMVRLSGFHNMVSMEPMYTVEDWDGQRVRAHPLVAQVLEKFGATPMFMSGGESYTAMATGLIDVYHNHRTSIYMRAFWEVANYYYEDLTYRPVSCPGLVVINENSWEALPDDLKQVWLSVARDWNAASNWILEREGLSDIHYKAFREGGLEFIDWPAEEFAKLEKVASEEAWPEWVASSGEGAQELLDEWLAGYEFVQSEYPEGLPVYDMKGWLPEYFR